MPRGHGPAHMKMMRGARKPRTSLEDRFWSRVDKSGGPNGCWPWTSYRLPSGYGRIVRGVNAPDHISGGVAQNMIAHRVAWELANGTIPEGKQVLHVCDCPPCQNIRHLYLGTNVDNMRDRVQRGSRPLEVA